MFVGLQKWGQKVATGQTFSTAVRSAVAACSGFAAPTGYLAAGQLAHRACAAGADIHSGRYAVVPATAWALDASGRVVVAGS